jgi:D-alanyl-D-alanine dipeptidase
MTRSLLATIALALTLAGCQRAATPEPAALAASGPPVRDTSVRAPEAPADSLPDLPDGFVRLRAVAPEIAQEMRYTTPFNFVGAPIDGYVRPECILTEPAAVALARVAADLAPRGLGLKVYDCYRPQAAVNHFARWARGTDEAMKDAFYPDEPKRLLFQRGYIAARSGHSRGSTVDLTLVRLPVETSVVPASAYPAPGTAPLPRCDRPLPARFPERDLDMGTAYDCLSTASATAFRGVSAEAQRNRQALRRAMAARGFRNYSKEWWHFTLNGEPFTGTYFDFPVE